ncbi:ThiF family adenylyltransferase [Thiohalobacter thiocyanaticus]|uniref:Uncharacterized protein n=1 Tax=Thiohalobacter thiocyanaticus TaxID=585455 RepID=A0A426QKK5_9GAMM|nr:E2/UBC family protein [Thiohalobacter thiocyanaticus]RRQ22246.1 hypothetical protein D6C00_09975 [Thiohalobacter thiocyanaticus]
MQGLGERGYERHCLPLVHNWLTENGFVHLPQETRRYAYDGVLQCNAVEVPIRLEFYDLTFKSLPEIYLRHPRPRELCLPLSHVDNENKLCYLEAESYRADPYHPVKTLATLIEQARRVLVDCLTGANADDVGYELSAYWGFKDFGVALSRQPSGALTEFNRIRYFSPLGNERNLVVVGTREEIAEYVQWRKAKVRYGRNLNAIWLDVNSTTLLPREGGWPPNNFRAFYDWLDIVDKSAARTLHRIMGTKAGCNSHFIVVINTKGGLVSIEVILPPSLSTATQAPGRFRKMLMRDDGSHGTTLIRGKFDDLSPKYQTARSLQGSGLSGKRIVLIGCGTIGGYLSRLLVQCGAGLGGELVLYDGQWFLPGNVGRHYLDGAYTYENKAEACQHKLGIEYPWVNIRALSKEYMWGAESDNADIIIDATGREPFSLALNEEMNWRCSNEWSTPPILHVWLDGNGLCGRTLYYDGTGGCYRCLQTRDGEERFEPLINSEDLSPMTYSCGESYIPFPPSASVQVAGLALELMLDWAGGSVGFTFRNRAFHKKARRHKDQVLTPMKSCPACRKN